MKGFLAKKREKKGGVRFRATTRLWLYNTPFPHLKYHVVQYVRSFDNMDEPSASMKFKSDFRGRLCQNDVKKVTSFVQQVMR